MSNKKIVVATIIYGNIEPIPYASHNNLWYRLGKDLPDWQFVFHSPWRYPIDTARNLAAKTALEVDAQYLFFYDSDMELDPHVLKSLLERDKPAVMAMCWIRGYPFEPMVFKYTEDRKTMFKYEPTEEDYQNEVFQCDAIGTACTLINTDVFRHMPEPYFLTGKYHTEDVYFCCKAREYVEGFECWVDTKVCSGHLLDPVVLNRHNVVDLRKFYEKYDSSGRPCTRTQPSVVQPNPLEASDV